jgi:hypothetical protein
MTRYLQGAVEIIGVVLLVPVVILVVGAPFILIANLVIAIAERF